MRKVLVVLILVCFFSALMRASDFAALDKQIVVEKVRIAFLENKNAQFRQEVDLCAQKIERLDESFCHLHKTIKKMKRNRQNVPGERKKLSEITEHRLLSEKSFYSRLGRTQVELEAADDLFAVLQRQVIDGQKAMAVRLSNIIHLEQSALYAMRLHLEKNETVGK